jgi:hypothetical protein
LLREKVVFYFKRMVFFGACPTDAGRDKLLFIRDWDGVGITQLGTVYI